MDNLLYRAWNKKEKRMYPVICINLNTSEVIVDTIAISKEYKEKIPTLTYKYPSDVLLLQYIGMEDINKNKIFDGDMIRWRRIIEDYGPENFIKNEYITGIVVWSEEVCGFIIEQFSEGMHVFKIPGETSEDDIISENYTKFYDEEGQQVFEWNDVEIIGHRFTIHELLYNRNVIK